MKIQEFLTAYEQSSATTSELSRNLSFAGIAVVWVGKIGDSSGEITISSELLAPLCCFVAALAADIVQYIYKTLIWGGLNCYYWNKYKNLEHDVNISGWVNVPTHMIFWGKVGLVAFGYFLLLCYLKINLEKF